MRVITLVFSKGKSSFMNKFSWIFLLSTLVLFSCKDAEQKQGATPISQPVIKDTSGIQTDSPKESAGGTQNVDPKISAEIDAIAKKVFRECDTIRKEIPRLIEDSNGDILDRNTGKRYRKGEIYMHTTISNCHQ